MSKKTCNCFIFAGPTLIQSTNFSEYSIRDNDNIYIYPPVKRGDIEQLIQLNIPGVIAIVDGIFHQQLSVGHAELRSALSHGWTIWGLSSMGAIRAYEMRNLGMKGFGYVYEQFCMKEDFRDDEVALIHEDKSPYTAFTEPLIHIRLGLNDLLVKKFISKSEYHEIIKNLEGIWFGERSLSFLRSLILNIRPDMKLNIDEWIKNFNTFRVKSHDLDKFLYEKPWKKH